MVGHARFDDGKGLLEQLIADRNQGQLLVFTLGHKSVKERRTGRIRFLGREAAPEELTANQAAANAFQTAMASAGSQSVAVSAAWGTWSNAIDAAGQTWTTTTSGAWADYNGAKTQADAAFYSAQDSAWMTYSSAIGTYNDNLSGLLVVVERLHP